MTTADLKATKAQKFVAELCSTIKSKFPEADFEISEGVDTKGIHIYAYAYIESVWDMLPLVTDRIADIFIAEGIPVYVIPMKKRHDQ